MPIEIDYGICPHCDHQEVRELTWFVSEDGSYRQLWSCRVIK